MNNLELKSNFIPYKKNKLAVLSIEKDPNSTSFF